MSFQIANIFFQNNVNPTSSGKDLLGWGWFLIVFGIICFILLVVFTEFKRKERESMKFSIIIIILTSFSIGLGIDLLLNYSGIW